MKRTPRCRRRKERVDLLRDMLIEALGNICAKCFSGEDLEINHLDGCTWDQRPVGRAARILRYVREYRAGVRLNVLCRSCNASFRPGDPLPSMPAMELEEAPF